MAYSDKQFSAMQEEAIKRVREMQKRSQNIMTDEKPQPEITPPPVKTNTTSTQKSNSGFLDGLLGGTKAGELFNISGIKIDEEKALIGILIYILYKQGADIKLLLGLGYLLL